MRRSNDAHARRVNRLQNLTILLLTCSMLLLAANLPLFGTLADSSLIELLQAKRRMENAAPAVEQRGAPALVFPVRIVYTNEFARVGADALTTVSDEFEYAGTFLGEALGSANGATPVSERQMLGALLGEGMYFDFTEVLPTELLSELLGVSAPELALVRRMLLCPADAEEAKLYVQDGTGRCLRYSTAVSSAALSDFLKTRNGSAAEFAAGLGEASEKLSPYTLVLSEPAPRPALHASNVLGSSEETILRRAEFNAHTGNRFTESSGTVIVREASSALYLRPDGAVDYLGGEATPESIYYVASLGETPTLAEASAAAQHLAVTLLDGLLGDAVLYLSGASTDGTRTEVSFDLMVGGTPLRRADGAHAGVVTVEGTSITAFTFNVRSYTMQESVPLLLPFAQAAAIARVWDGAELIVAYVDTLAEEVLPAWIAE
ncbi:MAG: hypothetical protein K6G54_09140 [Oscillospiraceae bacterium]|nr:hypothetical protein [Oscillospiraceae bacterium]